MIKTVLLSIVVVVIFGGLYAGVTVIRDKFMGDSAPKHGCHGDCSSCTDICSNNKTDSHCQH